MKKTLLFLILTIIAGDIARATSPSRTVIFRFVPADNMFYVRANEPVPDNAHQLQQLFSMIDDYHSEIVSGTIPVYVDSYCFNAQGQRSGRNLSYIRANRVKSELIIKKGLREEHFITKNHTTAFTDPSGVRYNDAVVVTLLLPPQPSLPEPESAPMAEPSPVQPEPQPEAETVVREPVYGQPMRIPADLTRGWYIRTNLLYDALLTPTIGVQWRINRNVGVSLDGSWAHWGSSHGRVHKIWLVNPQVNWYLLRDKRFYIGAAANFGEANVYKGLAKVISSDTGYQGNIYSGALTVGYHLPLCGNLSMDFNLGLGCTHFSYDTFTVSNSVRVYKERDLTKNFWGPTQAGITLLWHIPSK